MYIPIFFLFGLITILSIIYLLVFLRFGYTKAKSNVCLIGKTAVVTGGSSGIGYQIVLKLAARGCRVIIADKVIDEGIRKSIVKETNNPNIVLRHIDCASFKSIREFAVNLSKTEDKLDILVNNVGIAKCLNALSEDGLNLTMHINHYSQFLLTHLLVDLLKKSKNGRIIFTSSVISYLHVLFPSSVSSNGIKDLPSLVRFMDYANSKFCNVVSAKLFAKKLKKYNITSNAYHPLAAKTSIWKQLDSNINYWNVLDIIVAILMERLLLEIGKVDPSDACQAGAEIAISKEFENTTGIFYGKYFPNLDPRGSNDERFCESIWKASEKVVQLRPEERLE